MTIGPIGHEQWLRYCESYDLSREGRAHERSQVKPEREGVSPETDAEQTPVREELGQSIHH